MKEETIITADYLRANPNHIFVFGDNLLRYGTGGAAKLRHHKNTYGFITKKAPTYRDEDFYTPEEYLPVFKKEYDKLCDEIEANPDKLYLISRIGGRIANKHLIFECIIEPYIFDLEDRYDNIKMLF